MIAPRHASNQILQVSHLLLCQQQTEVDIVYKYRSCFIDQEYEKAHWWVGYDEQPGAEGMICSVFEKWTEISKRIKFSLLNVL